MAAGPVAETPPGRVSVAVRRARGAVVMMVAGDVDRHGSGLLQRVLTDLIEGQGNLRVLVDLTEAHIRDSEASKVFEVPAEQARRHGTVLSFVGASPSEPSVREHARLSELVDGVGA